MLYAFDTYAEDSNFDTCLIDLDEIQCLTAQTSNKDMVSLRFQLKHSPTPMFCSVLAMEYTNIVRALKAVHGEISIVQDGCVHYSSGEAPQ